MFKKSQMNMMSLVVGIIGIGITLAVGFMVIGQVNTQLALDTGTNSSNLELANLGTGVAGFLGSSFNLIAVGVIVLAAFGLINVFGRSSDTTYSSSYDEEDETEEGGRKPKRHSPNLNNDENPYLDDESESYNPYIDFSEKDEQQITDKEFNEIHQVKTEEKPKEIPLTEQLANIKSKPKSYINPDSKFNVKGEFIIKR